MGTRVSLSIGVRRRRLSKSGCFSSSWRMMLWSVLTLGSGMYRRQKNGIWKNGTDIETPAEYKQRMRGQNEEK